MKILTGSFNDSKVVNGGGLENLDPDSYREGILVPTVIGREIESNYLRAGLLFYADHRSSVAATEKGFFIAPAENLS
jgi:hypothetical protein